MTRIIIFTPEEKKSFNSPPLFNSLDRKKYFSFSTGILDIAGHLTKPENRIFFLVTYGYFKATHKFYNKRLHIKDIVYVADKIGFKKETLSTATYNIRSYSDHKKMILAYLGYKKFDREAARLVSSHMDSFLRSHARPKVMLQQAYEMLVKQKIENPSYNTLMTIISSEMKNHQKILTDTLQKCITKERKMLLDTLIHKKGNRYCLTLLKRFSQSTKPSRIKENMEDLKILRDLFQQVESLVDTVQLTNEGLRYYAYATIKSRILQVTRREGDKYLYLIAFIVHQYYTLQDQLFDILILAVQASLNKVSAEHKTGIFVMRKTKAQAITTMVMGVKKQQELVLRIRSILSAPEITSEEKINRIKRLCCINPQATD